VASHEAIASLHSGDPRARLRHPPCFVHGCQTALWGRKDLLHHFDVHIKERRKEFSLMRVDARQ